MASGTSAATLTLTGGGRLTSAELFKGTLSDADVSVEIDRGTLKATYDGRLDRIDPSIPFADPRLRRRSPARASCRPRCASC